MYEHFFPFYRLSFLLAFFDNSTLNYISFKFWWHLVHLFLLTFSFVVVSKVPMPIPRSLRPSPVSSWGSFIFLSLSFISLTHLTFLFAYDLRWHLAFSLLHLGILVPHVPKTLPFTLNDLGTLVKINWL